MKNEKQIKPEIENQKVVIELDYCKKVCDGCYSGTKFFTGLNHEDEASKWVDEMYKLPQVLTCKQQAVENKDITIVDILFLHPQIEGVEVEAWHIVGEHLRSGKPIPPDGEWLVHEGELVLHKSGYHANKRLIDALKYARGDTSICRVEVGGKIVEDLDILVAEKRKILWRVDGEPVLRAFARWCALQVADLWDAPELVIEYLATGAEKYREATRLVTYHSYWDLPLKNPFIENSSLYLTASKKLIEILAATVTLWATGEYCSACENAKLAAQDSATCLAAVSTYKANTLIDTIIAQNEQLERMVYEAHNGKKQWIFEYQIKE